MSTPARSILKAVLILLMPLVVIIGSVQLLSTDQYLGFEYGKASFPPDVYGFSRQQRFDLASTDVHYVRAHLPGDTLSKELLDGRPVYNVREVGHMADVRAVFQAVLRVWHLSLVLFLSLGFLLWQRGALQHIVSAIRLGGLLTAGLVLAITLLALFAWQIWFDWFHRLFFASGSWLFSYSDTLIRLFPLPFWVDATRTVLLFSLIGGIVLAVAGRRWGSILAKTAHRISP